MSRIGGAPAVRRATVVEMKLVITDGRELSPVPDPHLIAAVAQGRTWLAQINRRGEVQSVRDLAERHGVNQGDVSRILPLGLLAPDIVEAILAVARRSASVKAPGPLMLRDHAPPRVHKAGSRASGTCRRALKVCCGRAP